MNSFVTKICINIKKLHNDAIIPNFAKIGDAGADLYSVEDVVLEPNNRTLVHTGLAMEIPYGYEGCIRSRSGNALVRGYIVLNSPGTIDAGYRGEICIILFNTTDKPIDICKGDKIAQLVIKEVIGVDFNEVDQLSESDRGPNGFGSTGF